MSPLPLLVVTPIPEEMQEISRRSGAGDAPPALAALGLPWTGAGRLGGAEVLLAVTGDGARRAGRELGRVLEAVPVRGVIAAGVAGGLSPELVVGDLVCAREVAGPDDVRMADPALCALARGAAPGRVVSARKLALSTASKALLHRRSGGGETVVVDLESAAYAAAAEAAGVPWLVLRAVSDDADEELPAFLNDCLDGDGGIDRARVVKKSLLSPFSMPRLLVMKNRVEACSGLLAEAIDRIAAGWPEGPA